jgi:hypothetical protein
MPGLAHNSGWLTQALERGRHSATLVEGVMQMGMIMVTMRPPVGLTWAAQRGLQQIISKRPTKYPRWDSNC